MIEPATPESGDVSRFGRFAVIFGYLRLVHPVPITAVMLATLLFGLMFSSRDSAWLTLVSLLLAMLGGQVAIGALNELVDVELDAGAKPWKPIPAGRVTWRGARIMIATGLGIMVLFGIGFGLAAMLLLSTGTGLGLAYNLWFKRTPMSWLPYVLAVPLLPLWVRTALQGFDPSLLLLFPLGVGAVAAIHLAQSLPDAAGDKAAGLQNPVSMLGEARSLALACALAATAPLGAVAVAATVVVPNRPSGEGTLYGAAGLSLGLIGGLAIYYWRRPADAVRFAFPCLAMATLTVAVAWVLGGR